MELDNQHVSYQTPYMLQSTKYLPKKQLSRTAKRKKNKVDRTSRLNRPFTTNINFG